MRIFKLLKNMEFVSSIALGIELNKQDNLDISIKGIV
jgi:hypothetical protein